MRNPSDRSSLAWSHTFACLDFHSKESVYGFLRWCNFSILRSCSERSCFWWDWSCRWSTFLLWIWVAMLTGQEGFPILLQVFWPHDHQMCRFVPKYHRFYPNNDKIFNLGPLVFQFLNRTNLGRFQSLNILLFLKDLISKLGSSPSCKQSEGWDNAADEVIDLFNGIIVHVLVGSIINDKSSLYISICMIIWN